MAQEFQRVEEKLYQNRYLVDSGKPHISIAAHTSRRSNLLAMTSICPAGCYTQQSNGPGRDRRRRLHGMRHLPRALRAEPARSSGTIRAAAMACCSSSAEARPFSPCGRRCRPKGATDEGSRRKARSPAPPQSAKLICREPADPRQRGNNAPRGAPPHPSSLTRWHLPPARGEGTRHLDEGRRRLDRR